MRIVNPTFGYAEAEGSGRKIEGIDWSSEPIVLFSNSKPNASGLLRSVSARLRDMIGVKEAGLVSKGNAGMPAPPDVMAQIVGNHRVALLALAD